MNPPLMFYCEKCRHPLQSTVNLTTDGKVICTKCGHENTPPKGYTPDDSANIKVKGTYWGD